MALIGKKKKKGMTTRGNFTVKTSAYSGASAYRKKKKKKKKKKKISKRISIAVAAACIAALLLWQRQYRHQHSRK